MISTSKVFTENSLILSEKDVPIKQANARKSLRQFSETLNFKPNNAFCRLCAAR